jgi:hypothetical protein
MYKQTLVVYYFPGQVGQGKIKWEDAAAHALLRDRVLGDWPKDEAGWPKTLSKEDEAAYVGRLVAEERHAVSGLGGSQKAEVAWLDHHNIPYEEVDVNDFIGEDTLDVEPTIHAKLGSLKIVPILPSIHTDDATDSDMEQQEVKGDGGHELLSDQTESNMVTPLKESVSGQL